MTNRRKPGPGCCHRCKAPRDHKSPEMCIEYLAGVLEENKRLIAANRRLQSALEDATWSARMKWKP